MCGNHANSCEREYSHKSQLQIPFTPPFSFINKYTSKLLNSFYFHSRRDQNKPQTVPLEKFFYPLDKISNWNVAYGSSGFHQYQCVIPLEQSKVCLQKIINKITQANVGRFLGVLKTFGDFEPVGILSFPMRGVTLSVDIQNKGIVSDTLFSKLDEIVAEYGGRLYLAKDSRMSKELFEKGYPELDMFLKYRDPRISSAMSKRLMNF